MQALVELKIFRQAVARQKIASNLQKKQNEGHMRTPPILIQLKYDSGSAATDATAQTFNLHMEFAEMPCATSRSQLTHKTG